MRVANSVESMFVHLILFRFIVSVLDCVHPLRIAIRTVTTRGTVFEGQTIERQNRTLGLLASRSLAEVALFSTFIEEVEVYGCSGRR
jgi:hypothetical protein